MSFPVPYSGNGPIPTGIQIAEGRDLDSFAERLFDLTRFVGETDLEFRFRIRRSEEGRLYPYRLKLPKPEDFPSIREDPNVGLTAEEFERMATLLNKLANKSEVAWLVRVCGLNERTTTILGSPGMRDIWKFRRKFTYNVYCLNEGTQAAWRSFCRIRSKIGLGFPT